MKILITGATGLVGKKLAQRLFAEGQNEIRILTRNSASAPSQFGFPIKAFEWSPKDNYIEDGALDGVQCIIHLAGESVADGRWTDHKKKKILDSRVLSIKLLLNKLNEKPNVCEKFISASAIGYYGDRSDELLDEKSSKGTGFLTEVCEAWEQTLHNYEPKKFTTHSLRIGIVLSTEGGALAKMLPAFKAGVAGKLGSGKQFMSWIHIDDLVEQFAFLVQNKAQHTVYNGTAPNPVTNTEFTQTLCKTLHRPVGLSAPSAALKVLLGEQSIILLGSQNVQPKNFTEAGYKFKFNTLTEALSDLLKYTTQGEVRFTRSLWLEADPEKAFAFFSDEMNLEKITPEHLNFKVLSKSTEKIQPGTLIDYRISLYGVPLKWRTHIKTFKPNEVFIDEQLKGPYTKWHHTHTFTPVNGGTLMTDEVVYKVPLGLLGRLVAGAFVKNDVRKIFDHRNKIIKKLVS